MRWVTKYLLAITAACILMTVMNTASAVGEDISDLKKLISVNEYTSMNTRYAIQHSDVDSDYNSGRERT
jgi:predicted small secreted protein